jgi:DNA-binding Lrp family transcriptional regulator
MLNNTNVKHHRYRVAKLDKLDLKILEELKTDGRMSITDLAQRINSSRPTVTNHLEKLRKEGVVKIQTGLDLAKLGYKMAVIGLEVNGERFYDVMAQCPRVQTMFRTSDIANIQVGVWAEDDTAMKSCIECFRDLPNVRIVETKYLGTPVKGNVTLPLQLGDAEVAPCEKKCVLCDQYGSDWCPGCPVTIFYKNPLLKNS